LIPIFDGLELAQMIRQAGANANPYRLRIRGRRARRSLAAASADATHTGVVVDDSESAGG